MTKAQKTIIVIQSRLTSTRLPKKALLPLVSGISKQEKPILAWVLDAIKTVKADEYYLATDYASEELLAPIAQNCGFKVFAGPENDVLKRFCLLIEKTNADVVLRVTGDNPFLCVESAVATIERFSKIDADYFTFKGLPHGSGVEIFNAKSLLRAETLTNEAFDREHVGPALYNHQDKFTAVFEDAPSEWNYSSLRTTVDTPLDYARACVMAENLSSPAKWSDILVEAKKASKPILFVPSVFAGHGTGHLRRVVSLAKELFAFVYVPKPATLEDCEFLSTLDDILLPLKKQRILHELPSEIDKSFFALIVTDAFMLEKDLLKKLYLYAPVLSIDEGASFTDACDYLLDIIPSVQNKRKANDERLDFIPLPKMRKSQKQARASLLQEKRALEVLVCIGGEDPANLTMLCANAFAKNACNVTAVCKNAQVDDNGGAKNICIVPCIENLAEKLVNYDIVVTHYGFTAFEAVAAGCGVMLVATSDLHAELARHYGFVLVTKDDLNANVIKEKLSQKEKLFVQSDKMLALKQMPLANGAQGASGANGAQCAGGTSALANFLQDVATTCTRYTCPVCHESNCNDAIIFRHKMRTFRRCSNCGMQYISFCFGKKESYDESYFFDEYKNQYGKTYLEDFASIKALGTRRSLHIDELYWKELRKRKGRRSVKNAPVPTLLDIGSAYGPFLSSAKEAGWSVFGTDISKSAVDYVRDELGMQAVQAVFPQFDAMQAFKRAQFEAVTMWFVIEHFSDLKSVLQKVAELLPTGGIFAFSTPCASGLSARFNRDKFYEQSPLDHFTLWERENAKAILARFGFRVVKIVSTGLHPERFGLVAKKGIKKGSFAYKALSLYCKCAHLGDTFEVYCVKDF